MKMVFRRLLLAGSLSTLSGCAWFGDASQRADMMAAPAMAQTLAAIAPADHAQWPRPAWWEDFKIPALNRLMAEALAGSPNLKLAAARLRQSQALVDAQAAELYPTIDANVSFSAQRYSANSTQAKLAGENFRQLLINPLVLRYHVDFWGRDSAALAAAVGKSLAASAELADARLLLASAVAGGYFELAAANEKLALAEQIAADRQALLKLQQTRLATGLAATAPVLQAQTALHAARQTEAGARADVELRRNLLAALAGQGPDWGRRIEAAGGGLPRQPGAPSDLPLRLLARRPDLAAARLYAQAVAQEVKVAETAFYPDVNLVGFAGLHSVSLTDVLLQGSSLAYAVGPSVSLPIFEGGRLRAQLGYRQASYDAAVERYNNTLLHALQDVADAVSRRRDIDARLAEQRQTVADAAELERLADSLERAGLGDQTGLVSARLEALQQRYRLAARQAEQWQCDVQLIKALGGGYSENAVDLSKNATEHAHAR